MPVQPHIDRSLRPGFRPGISQPCMELNLRLDPPPAEALAGIDRWLSTCFGVEVPPLAAPRGRPFSVPERAAAGFAWRVMHLGGELLRAMRIPSFDPGRVAALQKAPGDGKAWVVRLLVPRADNVNDEFYGAAYRGATKAAQWMAGHAITPDATQWVFARLHEFVAPLLASSGLGAESTIPVLQQAWKKGIPFRHVGLGAYQLGWGARQVLLDRGSVGADSAIGARLSKNKWAAANVLRSAGLPAPRHRLIASTSAADCEAAALALGWPLVVKPVDCERGEGVTVDVHDPDALRAAFAKAAALSDGVLVERQVEGVCHRIQVIDGRAGFVARRMPKGVRGDGRGTVRELVDRANRDEEAKPPWTRLKPFPLDDLALASLAAAGFTPDSIPPEGTLAPLRRIQSSASGGVVDDFTQTIHPDNQRMAEQAARLFGLAVAGIDVISPDITQPWHANGAIVNEVNFSPLLAGRTSMMGIDSLLVRWPQGGGRIPVVAVVGGEDAAGEGKRVRDALRPDAGSAWIVTGSGAESSEGEARVLASEGLFANTLAMLSCADVGALVMLVQDDEFLRSGLPVDRIDRLIEAHGADRLQAVSALLRAVALQAAAASESAPSPPTPPP